MILITASIHFSKNLLSSLENLKKLLINLSGLGTEDTEKLNMLRELFSCISFKENASIRGKYQAVAAASYPAFLAKAAKKYNDIDIFVLWNANDHINMRFVKSLHKLDSRTRPIINQQKLPYASINGIMKVVNVGRLQIIVKEYDHHCDCMSHIDKIFFETFHHACNPMETYSIFYV